MVSLLRKTLGRRQQAPSSQVAQPLSPTFVSVVLPSAADTPIDANCNNVNNQNVCLGTHQDYVSPAIVRNFAPTQAGSTTTSYTHQPTVAASLSGYTSAASESTAPGSVLSWPPANIAAAFASCSRDFDEQQHIQEVQYQEQPLKHQETKRGLLEHRAVQTRSACTDTSNTTVDVERKRKVQEKQRIPVGVNTDMYAVPGIRRVGNYDILDTLGKGYSGKVKRGRDIRTGEYVALKIMRLTNESRSGKELSRLGTEIAAMQACAGHKHTVKLFHYDLNARYPKKDGTSREVSLLVMELCENRELFDLLYEEGPVPATVCKEYFRQLMSGIDHLHANDISHRDLKPENLLLDANFSLKIADFGFSAAHRGNNLCSSIVGSRIYMAPELHDRRQYVGQLADVWSAGVILFTMLAGHPPMEEATKKDWWFRALQMKRQDLFWKCHERSRDPFPEDAKDLVNKMLTTEPSERIKVPDILKHPYVAVRRSFMPFSRNYSEDVAAEVISTMTKIQENTLASKRPCYNSPAESSRGTVSSAGSTSHSRSPLSGHSRSPAVGAGFAAPSASGSGASGASNGSMNGGAGMGMFVPAYTGDGVIGIDGMDPTMGLGAGMGGMGPGQEFYHPRHWNSTHDPFSANTYRSVNLEEDSGVVWKEGCLPSAMSEAEAKRISGGFMANGRATSLMEEIERALKAMGAEFLDPKRRRMTAPRSSFKVEALFYSDTEKTKKCLVLEAKIYRVVQDGQGAMQHELPSDDGERLMVVLRRREGTHNIYHKLEKSLVSRIVAKDTLNGDHKSPTP